MPSLSLPEWETIHTNFYNKYSGLGAWQHANFELVNKQGWYTSFTGRRYYFQKNQKRDGSWEYSWPAVCNYIVQGTSTGDVVPLVMVHLLPKFRRLSSDILMINQVHDSIVIDCPDQYVTEVCKICIDMFRNIPKLVKKYYNYDWVVPMSGECKYGETWGNMTLFKE